MVSIIIPCYNGEKYIKRCLDSILSQDYEDFEIILINDGSTDSSDKIIKSYHDERLRYFKNDNQGIGKTRNFGISMAKGEFVTFLDIDDYLNNKAISKMVECAYKDNLDLVISDYYVKSNKTCEYKIKDFKVTSVKENPEIILDVNLAPWGKLYKKELIKDIKFEEDLKYEDAPFVIKSLLEAKKIGKLNYPTVYYVINENSETNVRDEKVFDIIEIVDIIRKILISEGYEDVFKKFAVKTLTNYTVQQRVNIDPKIGDKFIEETFSYLRKYVPDYKKNKYYSNRGFIRSNIEKSEFLTKIYCKIYQKLNK